MWHCTPSLCPLLPSYLISGAFSEVQDLKGTSAMFRKIISTSASWVPVPLRLALAAIFIAHGAQKVLGSFHGPGLAKFTSFPAPFPFMRPGWLWMGAAAFAELLGGALLLLGLLTRVGAFLILCVMVTAIAGPTWNAGFFAPNGFEFPLALAAMSLALLISGGGVASVDQSLSSGRRR
jgi:putative oxidoreductase